MDLQLQRGSALQGPHLAPSQLYFSTTGGEELDEVQGGFTWTALNLDRG